MAAGARGGDAEVEPVAGGELGTGVGREEFNGVVDARDGEEGFVGVSYSGKKKKVSKSFKLKDILICRDEG